ncbi:MAG TPA: aminotransferase class I/II-fold pyridoxal phosphate-dependent enzyme [Gaiellaceae bacterium]|nr:aminotransferase class I/II-fold pyridoxal phosphate-dependent enzyme [Gaiellaceae bacterium]
MPRTSAPAAAIAGRTARAIASSIEAQIRDGGLRPGVRLPTIRSLATDLGVSPMTVASAYRELSRRGLLNSAGRRGTSVSDGPPLPVGSAPLVPTGARDLTTGNPDPELLPQLAPALAKVEPRPRAHPNTNKLDRLVARAEVDFGADGIPTPALAVVAGALDGVERVLAAHLAPGDAIAVEDPCFIRIFDLLRAIGLVPVPVAVDDDGPQPDELERALAGGAAAFLLTPRWQNPFGARLTDERAGELRQVLDRFSDVLLIEDDHAGLIAGEPAFTLAPRKRWASVRSASKALGADFRLAVMTGDQVTIARVEGRQLLGTGWVSHLLQELVAHFWTDEAMRKQLEQTAGIYTTRRELLLNALADRGISAHGASGLNVWIPVAEEATTVGAMLERGWAVIAGERWRLRSGPAIRITTATLQDGEAEAIAEDLEQILTRRPAAYSS